MSLRLKPASEACPQARARTFIRPTALSKNRASRSALLFDVVRTELVADRDAAGDLADTVAETPEVVD